MKPSFLALRELSFAKGRFMLMGAVVALITVLMVLLSGLSVGLVNDGVSGLKRLPVTSFAFQEGVEQSSAFSRSVVNLDAVAIWAQQPGVAHAAPFGNTLVNGSTNKDVEIDLAIFGIEPQSFLNPPTSAGNQLATDGQVVLGQSTATSGIAVGDVIELQPNRQRLTVVGFLQGQNTFGHVDVGYVSLRSWQQAKAGLGDGDPIPPRVLQEATAVAVQAAPGADVNLAAGDAAADTTSLTLQQSFSASPGYSAETSTLQLIQAFLYIISALVVGAFFTVLTIQRKGEIAVLRALGASTAYLLRDSLMQSVVLLLISGGVGIAAGLAMGVALSATDMPFSLAAGPITGAALLLFVLGVAGAGIAVLRITRVDPLTALGGNR